MGIETKNTGCRGNVIIGTRSSPKTITFLNEVLKK